MPCHGDILIHRRRDFRGEAMGGRNIDRWPCHPRQSELRGRSPRQSKQFAWTCSEASQRPPPERQARCRQHRSTRLATTSAVSAALARISTSFSPGKQQGQQAIPRIRPIAGKSVHLSGNGPVRRQGRLSPPRSPMRGYLLEKGSIASLHQSLAVQELYSFWGRLYIHPSTILRPRASRG